MVPFATCCALATIAGVAQAGALSGSPTRATLFSPFTSVGAPASRVDKVIHGSCYVGSVFANRSNAWRCGPLNKPEDPCFSSPKAPTIVLCPAGWAWQGGLVEIKLTRKLPLKYAHKAQPSTAVLPWELQTVSGWDCERDPLSGRPMIRGDRLSYYCTHTNDVLWGPPSRRTKVWQIAVALIHAHTITGTVGIRSAWF